MEPAKITHSSSPADCCLERGKRCGRFDWGSRDRKHATAHTWNSSGVGVVDRALGQSEPCHVKGVMVPVAWICAEVQSGCSLPDSLSLSLCLSVPLSLCLSLSLALSLSVSLSLSLCLSVSLLSSGSGNIQPTHLLFTSEPAHRGQQVQPRRGCKNLLRM